MYKVVKKFKRIICMCICFTLVMSLSSVNVFAETKELQDRLKNLEKKYDFVLKDIDESIPITMKFKNVEEFEKYMKKVQKEREKIKNSTKVINIKVAKEPEVGIKTTYYNDTDTITWWALPPFFMGIATLCMTKNVSFNYQYYFYNGHPTFYNVSNINSYIGGFTVGYTWNHTNGIYNLKTTVNYNDTAKIKVTGYYLLGIQIGDFQAGFTFNETWDCSLRLTN